jgi:CheY-like chemotaxis protein
VAEAADGQQAVDLVAARNFDVMFLELALPVLDGAGVLAALAQKKKSLPTVLISSSESSSQMVNAFKLGAKDFLLKPFREAQIHRALRQATGLDFTTIQRTRTDMAVLDRDEGLAQTLRAVAGDLDAVEQAELREQVHEVVARGHQLVFVGTLEPVKGFDEAEAAEALADEVSQLDPRAAIIRLLPEGETHAPDLSVVHAAIPRTDEAIARVVTAVRSGAALTAGRLVRALRYDGPPELVHLYWWTLKNSTQAALLQLVTGVKAPPKWRGWAGGAPGWGAAITLDLSLAPDDEAQLGTLVDWAVGFARSRMVELALLRDRATTAASAPSAATANDASAASTPAAAATPSPTPAADPGTVTVPGVELGEVLGEGRVSRSFVGTQKSLKRRVCIKVLQPSLAVDPALAQQFQDEGVSLAGLRHPNIVSVLDVGRTDEGHPFLMTEFVEGSDLSAFAKQERVPVATTVELVGQLLSALGEAHGNDILHRDLKPSNVFLTKKKDGSTQVKVMDFGLARLVQVGPGQAGASSAGYLAPEQMLGMQATFASDLYSVGVILFELLAGRRPFVAKDNLELMQLTMMMPVPQLKEVLGPDAPEPLDKLLASLLAKNPKDRPLGASVVRAALLAVAPSSAA